MNEQIRTAISGLAVFDSVARDAIKSGDTETMTRLLLVLNQAIDPLVEDLQAGYKKVLMERARERSREDYGRL